jgi:HK97 family phage major capsid protein
MAKRQLGADGVVRVKREPLVYTPTSRHSWLQDLARSVLRQDREAAARIERHEQEMRREYAALEVSDGARFRRVADTLGLEVERRVNPNTTLGTAGEFAPPLWAVDRWAGPARASRPFGDLLNPIPLPAGVQSINIPKITTGSLTGVQPGQGVAAPQQDWTTQNNNSPVVTIAGNLDVSRQLLEQSPANPGFDVIAGTDLTADYNFQLEAQLLAGTGANGQLLGLSNFTIPAANTISGAGITTFTGFWPLLGQAAAAVGNQRKLPMQFWLMAPRRWAWMASSFDSQNRPIASPMSLPKGTDFPPAGMAAPAGAAIGHAIYEDGAIPAGTTADPVYSVRPDDMLLLEGAPRVLVAGQTIAGTLQVRFSFHRYVAFVGNRFSGGLSIITALPAPANY